MTPIEANEEARVALANAKWDGGKARIETDVLECLMATTEREAKLREAAGRVVRTAVRYRSGPGSRYCDVASDVMENLREALESKGSETCCDD